MIKSALHYDVIVIGGGASGLMCAITAGQRGRSVLVLERSRKPGRKILMSGGGRCNFTNLNMGPEYFLSGNPRFCISALCRYTQWDFIALIEKYAIPYHEREHGQLFCNHSAKDLLTMLLQECQSAGVKIQTLCEVVSIDHSDQYHLETAIGSFTAESLVIATGGLSIPRMGSTGFAYQIASQFGLQLVPRKAGLVPFTFTDPFQNISTRLSGIAIPARVSAGNHSFLENILFTHRGLSGPAVLQLSNYWHPGRPITLDLLPDQDSESLLKSWKETHPKSLLRSLLCQYFPKSLVSELEQLWWMNDADKTMIAFSDKQLMKIAFQLKHWELKPSGTEGYRTAEVTSGGIDTNELSSKTMECKDQPGLFIIGEAIDVTGHLGGYNFQWAWSSGYVAGLAV